MKLAVFDFCDTLIPFQSADCFVRFVINSKGGRIRHAYVKLVDILDRLKFFRALDLFSPKLNIKKKALLISVRGISISDINRLAQDFFNQNIKDKLVKETLDMLTSYQNEGHEVIIVSGGYLPYLQLLQNYLGLDKIVASEFEYRGEIATGFLKGSDCLREEKVRLLNKLYPHTAWSQFDQVVCVSDSISDLPLLKWGTKAVVVSKKMSQKWPITYSMQELII